MTPKTRDKRADLKQEKRLQIMTAALEVFAMHGYHGASISHIASTANVAKGLIYNYFESKEALLKAIIVEGINDMLVVFEPAINADLTSELFAKLIKSYFKMLKENKPFWQLYFSLALQPNVAEMLEKEIGPMANNYIDLLVKYYTLQGSKNPHADSMLTHALLDGITLNTILTHQDFDMESAEQTIIEQVVKARF